MNKLGRQTSFHISESSEIASARRTGNELARRLAFDEVRTGQVAIVITEAGTNIVKHAERGEILLRPVEAEGRRGIEILAIDRGPGMSNVPQVMEDGHSTAGSYGVGLGAISRLTQEFDIYSVPGQGTVMMMVLWDDGIGPHESDWQAGAVCLPLAGEDLCGDAFALGEGKERILLCAADGLGHGPDAAAASDPAVAMAESWPDLPAAMVIEKAHTALRGSRGAAMAVASIDPARGVLEFVGVGNLAGCIFYQDTRRHLMSHNGIVGSNMRKVQEFAHEWGPGATLIVHSDGIATRWDVNAYQGLMFRHPSLIAAVLYRDFARQRDDAMVVVLRQRSTMQ